MNEKLLKWLIYFTGIICFIAFVAIRFQGLFNACLKEPVVPKYWDKTKYGELYYFSMIDKFKEKGLPPAKLKFEHSDKHASVQDCEILMFGDSFFEFSRHKQFPEIIADDFNKKVHYVNYDYPLNYLESNGYHDTIPKLVVFERVERYIPVAFEKTHIKDYAPEPELGIFKKIGNYILDKIFYSKSEELFDAMLKRSYLTNGVYCKIATIKFNLFGYISKLTPKYYVEEDNSWLFYHDQVNDEKTSFYYQFTNETIDSICDNMANLAAQLKEDYNMTVLYLPIPAKYTLYHDLINNDEYNNLLPRLYKGLDKRGVKYINLFSDYQKSDTLLYYRTDSHWNQKGIDIAYNKFTDYIESDTTLNVFFYKNSN